VIAISFGNINYQMAFFLDMPVLFHWHMVILVMGNKPQLHSLILLPVFHYQPWVYYIFVIMVIIGFV
jgi:hypothetical protein